MVFREDYARSLESLFRQRTTQTPLFRTFLTPIDADLQREFNGLIFVKNDQGTKPGGIF
jgi:hypothetical protein